MRSLALLLTILPACDSATESEVVPADALFVGSDGARAALDAAPPGSDGAAPDQELPDAAAGPDGAVASDVGPTPDAATPIPDALTADVPVPVPDAAIPDAASAARPFGQCDRNADCPSGDCNARAPGGICRPAPCPDDAPANEFGGCVRPCAQLADCPRGLECSDGSCIDPRCVGDGDCESPYVCTDGLCARPPCDGGCPDGMECVGSYCVRAGRP